MAVPACTEPDPGETRGTASSFTTSRFSSISSCKCASISGVTSASGSEAAASASTSTRMFGWLRYASSSRRPCASARSRRRRCFSASGRTCLISRLLGMMSRSLGMGVRPTDPCVRGSMAKGIYRRRREGYVTTLPCRRAGASRWLAMSRCVLYQGMIVFRLLRFDRSPPRVLRPRGDEGPSSQDSIFPAGPSESGTPARAPAIAAARRRDGATPPRVEADECPRKKPITRPTS